MLDRYREVESERDVGSMAETDGIAELYDELAAADVCEPLLEGANMLANTLVLVLLQFPVEVVVAVAVVPIAVVALIKHVVAGGGGDTLTGFSAGNSVMKPEDVN